MSAEIDLSTPNMQRGKQLFYKNLSEMDVDLDSDGQARLAGLTAALEGRVAVMPEPHPITGELLFAAARMARAVTNVALSATSEDDLVAQAIENYNGLSRNTTTVKADSVKTAVDEELEREIESGLLGTMVEVEQEIEEEDEDGNITITTKTMLVDDIDLVSTLRSSYLTDEGKRARGIIDVSFDSTSGVAPAEKAVEERKLGSLRATGYNGAAAPAPANGGRIILPGDKDFTTDKPEAERAEPVKGGLSGGAIEIVCPHCGHGGAAIYPIHSEIFGCFDCGQEFEMEEIESGDIFGEDEDGFGGEDEDYWDEASTGIIDPTAWKQ